MPCISTTGFPAGTDGKKNLLACAGDGKRCGFDPQGWKDPLEESRATNPIFLPGESHG